MRDAPDPAARADPADALDLVARWAASGAMALSGTPGRALGPPDRLLGALDALAAPFPGLDPLTLLVERAAIAGLSRHGTTSCGEGSRLLPTADGWIAASLPRDDDMAAVPAWLELEDPSWDAHAPVAAWRRVAAAVRDRAAAEVVERARLLQLPVAALGERAAPTGLGDDQAGVAASAFGPAPPRALGGVLVVELASLWAGPLCGHLLAGAGATVVKVESTGRPDGARRGPTAFFDLMNAGKRSVALDLTARVGRSALVAVIEKADVVIEGSRPRALAQLGIDARAAVSRGPQVWVSITGYGRSGDAATRVAFGDDAAVAGALVVRDRGRPRFCADAVADPLAGLAAAGAVRAALQRGGRWLIDVAMADVAASCSGPTLPVPSGIEAAPPRARPVSGRARSLGADTASVLAELGA